ncbi:MAG: DNA mismatch repair protein MutS, partial [Spirochaetia bacterium]|nr:DNA mismatch repair protein MutS [Spirochaetia bacterium]
MSDANAELTPMMRQFMAIKKEYKEEILFFRMGDFYEMFHDDAIYASRILGIALTKRGDGIPMCGVPHHAVANYVHPILDDGRNIAICEQMETPEEAQGSIVRREVVRVLTPGTIFEENMLAQGENRLIAAAVADDSGFTFYAIADISTGDIWLEKEPGPVRFSLLGARGIREVVMDDDFRNSVKKENLPLYFRRLPPVSKKEEILNKSFGVENSQVLELSLTEANVLSLLLFYIHEVVPRLHTIWKKPRKEYLRKIMHLDETALKTLEIISSQSGDKDTSLLAVIDKTITSAGRRLLVQMLLKPSTDVAEIQLRQNAILFAMKNRDFVEQIKTRLRQVYDIERIISLLQNHPQVRHLGNILVTLEATKQILNDFKKQNDLPEIFRQYWLEEQFPFELFNMLNETLYMENLPPLLDERRFIQQGYNAELDDLLNLGGDAGNIIISFEQREKQRLDINTLKVRYNKVIGYYIEISKGQVDKAPSEYSRRQTLVNAERYTCEELKTLEDRILGARERIIDLQRSIFDDLVARTLACIDSLRYWADVIALCDVVFCFAKTALERNYVCPEIFSEGDLRVVNSRHPVVEHL